MFLEIIFRVQKAFRVKLIKFFINRAKMRFMRYDNQDIKIQY